jgi:RNA ligase (TIGR02306 family)
MHNSATPDNNAPRLSLGTARKLAVVGKITATRSINGADFIHAATVNCAHAGTWEGVVAKQLQTGQLVMVFLQDALLPPDARWAFMEKHKWRVSMARFKGVPSECVILELPAPFHTLEPGADLTEALGVTKYEKPLPMGLAGDFAAAFPSFLPKTDEENFQAVDFQTLLANGPWCVTEKADGSSCTAWVDADGLHVCSRNWELKEFNFDGGTNVYWRAARKYSLETMPIGTAVQFEVVGPGVQGNPMALSELEGRLFCAHRADAQGRWAAIDPASLGLSVPAARQIGSVQHATRTAEQLRELAAIFYAPGKPGEGVVIRAQDQSWSFKVINLNYKQ